MNRLKISDQGIKIAHGKISFFQGEMTQNQLSASNCEIYSLTVKYLGKFDRKKMSGVYFIK